MMRTAIQIVQKYRWVEVLLVTFMIASQFQPLRARWLFNLDSLCALDRVSVNWAGADVCMVRLPHYLQDADLTPQAIRLASLVALAVRRDDITRQVSQMELVPQQLDIVSASRVLLLRWLDGRPLDLGVWRGVASSQIIADTTRWLGTLRANREVVEAVELAYLLDDGWRDAWQRGLNARTVGKQYIERGQLAQARAAYERAATSLIRAQESLAPEYACYAYLRLGAIAEQQGDLAGALEYYGQAILASSRHVDFSAPVDVILKQERNLQDAYLFLADLRQKGRQDDPYLWSNSALVFIERGAPQMAERVLAEVPSELEGAPNIRYVKARLAAAQSKWPIAESLYAILLAEEKGGDKPDSQKVASLANALGETILQQGRYTEAITRFAEAVQLAPDIPRYWYNLGVVYQRLGNSDEARAALDKALALKPDYVAAQKALQELKR